MCDVLYMDVGGAFTQDQTECEKCNSSVRLPLSGVCQQCMENGKATLMLYGLHVKEGKRERGGQMGERGKRSKIEREESKRETERGYRGRERGK